MVSHLRKMSPLSRETAANARTRRPMSPLFPLFTGVNDTNPEWATQAQTRDRMSGNVGGLVSGRPGLVVAGGRWPAAAGQRRAGRPVGRGRPRHVRDMRFFPLARHIVLFGRRDIDGVMDPAMP